MELTRYYTYCFFTKSVKLEIVGLMITDNLLYFRINEIAS